MNVAVRVGRRPRHEVKVTHRWVFAGFGLSYILPLSKAARMKFFSSEISTHPLVFVINIFICNLFAGQRRSTRRYDQAWLQSLALTSFLIMSDFHEASSPKLDVLCNDLLDLCELCPPYLR